MQLARASEEPLMTAAEFADLPSTDGRRELNRGRVIEMPPVGAQHGMIDNRLAVALSNFVNERKLGQVFGNTGFLLSRNPDVVRGPDQAFISAAALAAHPMPARGFWAIAPDLVVEVISPDDSAEEIEDKVDDYLSAGVRLVWIVYPRTRTVHVCRRGQPMVRLEESGSLDGADVLPGFQLRIAELF